MDTKIEYTISENGEISPVTPQSGGVLGDDNTVTVCVDMSAITVESDEYIRIDFSNGAGGFYSSGHLTLADGVLSYKLPYEVTIAGGTAQAHVVIVKFDGKVEKVRYSFPIRIYFKDSTAAGAGYSRYSQELSGITLEARGYSESARISADEAKISLDEHNTDYTAHAELIGEVIDRIREDETELKSHNTSDSAHSAKFSEINLQLSQMAPLAALSAALSSHNTDDTAHAELIGEVIDRIREDETELKSHNTDDTAHSAKFSEINLQLNQKAPLAALSAAISSHNTDDTAHAELFGEVIDRIREDKADLSAALTAALSAHNTSADSHTDLRDSLSLLQKCLSYKYSVTGGAVQRIDDVSPIEHTADITVHGTTDENGNGVKDPKVNVYGKNLFVFKTKSADGYVFSGSTVTVNAPTQHYGFNSTSTVNLPAGTYTISCNISGERTYNDGKPGFLVFYKIDDSERSLSFSSFTSGENRVSKTFTLTEPAVLAFSHVWFSEIPPSADLTLKVQLEVGDAATEFEEYKEPQMFFAAHEFMQGQSWNLSTSNTVKAVSPTMTVIVTDDNCLVNTVDVTYNADLIKRISTLEAAIAALA